MPMLAGLPELEHLGAAGGGSRDVADAKELLSSLRRIR